MNQGEQLTQTWICATKESDPLDYFFTEAWEGIYKICKHLINKSQVPEMETEDLMSELYMKLQKTKGLTEKTPISKCLFQKAGQIIMDTFRYKLSARRNINKSTSITPEDWFELKDDKLPYDVRIPLGEILCRKVSKFEYGNIARFLVSLPTDLPNDFIQLISFQC